VGQKLDVCDIVYDTNGLRTAMDAMAARFHGNAYTNYVVLPVQVPHAAAPAAFKTVCLCWSMSERASDRRACLPDTCRTAMPQWRKSLLLDFDTDAANRVTIADITLEGMMRASSWVTLKVCLLVRWPDPHLSISCCIG
jgi:hypothetical protein